MKPTTFQSRRAFCMPKFTGKETEKELQKMMDDSSKKDEENENEDDDSYYNESKKSYYVFMVASVGIMGTYLFLLTLSFKKFYIRKNFIS